MKMRLFLALFAIWLLALGTIFAIQVGISTYLLERQSRINTEKDLASIVSHIEKDIEYKNGTWDMSLFNADPITPYPNSSGSYPLYVMTLDGFVISRTNVITGLLDTSDQASILRFATAQTVRTPTNESWRLLAKRVEIGQTSAVILVAYFEPQPQILDTIDQKLLANITQISRMLSIHEGKIDVSGLDARKLDYDISFEVVDASNTILASNGRTPTYIDPSYVYRQLNGLQEKTVQDTKTGEIFLTYTTPLKDSVGNQKGIIVVGKSIQSNNLLIANYIASISQIMLVLLIPIAFLAFITTLFFAQLLHIHQSDPLTDAETIVFDKKSGKLTLGNTTISFDPQSLQYLLCNTLFTHPNEIFTQDELANALNFSATSKEYKKIYDAMLGINRKVGSQLIMYKDKQYSLNPVVKQKIK